MPQPSASPAPLASLRCTLDYPALDDFIARFGRNLSRAGVFLPMREPLEVGNTVRFEVVLADARVALRGEGVVSWRAPYEPGANERLHGMGVRFTRLDGHSREVIERVMAHKAAHRDEFFEPARDPVLAPTSPFAFVGPQTPAAPVASQATATAAVPAVSTAPPAAKPTAPAAPVAPPAAKPASPAPIASAAAPIASVAAPIASAAAPIASAAAPIASAAAPIASAAPPTASPAAPAPVAPAPSPSQRTPVMSQKTPVRTPQKSAATPRLRPTDSAQTPKIELPVPAAASGPRAPVSDSTRTPSNSAKTPIRSTRTPAPSTRTPALSAKTPIIALPGERAAAAQAEADELAALRSPSGTRAPSANSPEAAKRLHDLLGRRPGGGPAGGKD